MVRHLSTEMELWPRPIWFIPTPVKAWLRLRLGVMCKLWLWVYVVVETKPQTNLNIAPLKQRARMGPFWTSRCSTAKVECQNCRRGAMRPRPCFAVGNRGKIHDKPQVCTGVEQVVGENKKVPTNQSTWLDSLTTRAAQYTRLQTQIQWRCQAKLFE